QLTGLVRPCVSVGERSAVTVLRWETCVATLVVSAKSEGTTYANPFQDHCRCGACGDDRDNVHGAGRGASSSAPLLRPRLLRAPLLPLFERHDRPRRRR